MSRVNPGEELGICVGQNNFMILTTLMTALCCPQRVSAAALLQRFDEEAGHLGLHVSLEKTTIQNVGHGAALSALSVGANTVDSVSEFIQLDSKIFTDGYSTPDVMRRMALASSVMNQLGRVWRQRNPSLNTKLRLYET